MISNFCESQFHAKIEFGDFVNLHFWGNWSLGPADFFLPGVFDNVQL